MQIKAEDVHPPRPRRSLTRLFDVTATKDWANCAAQADVVGRRPDARCATCR